jgi:hypothetical protein
LSNGASRKGFRRSKNEPGAAGNREHPYDSHQNVSTFDPASGPRAESGSAACGEAGHEVGRKARRQDCFEGRARAAGIVPLLPRWLGRDC